MAFEKRDLSGALFKNARKAKDSHPDYTGDCVIDGKEFYMSAWLKESKKGKFMSFAFTKKEAKQEPDLNEDIPF